LLKLCLGFFCWKTFPCMYSIFTHSLLKDIFRSLPVWEDYD
jgi:hypothetical protein